MIDLGVKFIDDNALKNKKMNEEESTNREEKGNEGGAGGSVMGADLSDSSRAGPSQRKKRTTADKKNLQATQKDSFTSLPGGKGSKRDTDIKNQDSDSSLSSKDTMHHNNPLTFESEFSEKDGADVNQERGKMWKEVAENKNKHKLISS
jgi:hypothetical protein